MESFNGAALTRARSSVQGRRRGHLREPLQWGRAYKSAELRNQVPNFVLTGMASMGPRLQERGVRFPRRRYGRHMLRFNGAALTRARSSKDSENKEAEEKEASMGPRLQERGVFSVLANPLLASSSFNGAALTRARSSVYGFQSQRFSRCFNGAALTRARSSFFVTLPLSAIQSASMGPRLQERGVCCRHLGILRRLKASMGPRLQERGVARFWL